MRGEEPSRSPKFPIALLYAYASVWKSFDLFTNRTSLLAEVVFRAGWSCYEAITPQGVQENLRGIRFNDDGYNRLAPILGDLELWLCVVCNCSTA
ncbi:hypothetical protein PpBr36_04146 [Pyricularia pennisetigena]|uniref:hypothetical protein n=1 Tax=Pyricularia pennisetigena TaxID=1578925 RepID=UPI00114F047F|nr:hypothetical protein PpBr36_04146 [Pyricularia pennisetigena]TLS27055.1 hypothetical protein PpBr36_04146 [Pyricularia pennisetigena]